MLDCQKHRFHLPDGVHYLNCAYMGPLLKAVEEAGVAGVRRRRRPNEIGPEAFFEGADRARSLFARLVHARDPARVAIVPSVSYGIATVAKNARLESGQSIVVAREQFPSNVYAWRGLARRNGAELRTVGPSDSVRRGEAWSERLVDAIDETTALVALGTVHWTDGTRFDLERIGERAREVGAAFVVDGTQSVGAMPFDVRAVRPDALVCASYKWLLGPFAVGFAWLGPRYTDGSPLEETWLGRAGSEDFQGLVDYTDAYQPGAARFDMGQRSNFALIGMTSAALEQLLEWGVPRIEAYIAGLTRPLIERAGELGFRVDDPAWVAPHIVGLRVPGGTALAEVKRALDGRGVVVSLRGDAVRVSPHLHADGADIDALVEGLREAVGAETVAGPRS
ncbi:MAG: aminotransferase class V-fold PLP-dependent enzyme [Gemmatimonadota bacterium]